MHHRTSIAALLEAAARRVESAGVLLTNAEQSFVFYHGSKAVFDTPRLSADGFFWLAPSYKIAKMFAERYAKEDDDAAIYEITLKPSTKLVDMKDLRDPDVVALREHLTATESRATKDTWWKKVAAQFDFVEQHSGIIVPFMTDRGIAGVKVIDIVTAGVNDYRGIKFLSVGLWDLSAIRTFRRTSGFVAGGLLTNAKPTVEAAAHLVKAARLFPAKESPDERASRSRDYPFVFRVDAAGLRAAWEHSGQNLPWNPKRTENLRRLVEQGAPINAYPKVGLNSGGGLFVDDGRHRIGLAAELGMDIEVAAADDIGDWLNFLAETGRNRNAVPSSKALKQAIEYLLKHYNEVVSKDREIALQVLRQYFPGAYKTSAETE